MAKFCGGFKFNDSLKLIDGILCLAETQAADKTKAVTVCGQMWDGASFKVVKVDGGQVYHLTAQDINEDYTAKWLGEANRAVSVATNATFGKVISNPKFDNYPFLIFVYENTTGAIASLYSQTTGEHTLKISY